VKLHPYMSLFLSSLSWMLSVCCSTPRPMDQATPSSSYPHPTLSLPHPSLNLDFRMSVTLNPRISVGPTPFGHRNWISFTGGTWSGAWGSGIVLVMSFSLKTLSTYCLLIRNLARRSRQSDNHTRRFRSS
jgi:hypothetical protein